MRETLVALIMTFGATPQGWYEVPREVCYEAYQVNADGVVVTPDGERIIVRPRCIMKIGL